MARVIMQLKSDQALEVELTISATFAEFEQFSLDADTHNLRGPFMYRLTSAIQQMGRKLSGSIHERVDEA
jgi:hypothetical protein